MHKKIMFENLSLHTKVRRLGYLKLMIKQYFAQDFIPANTFDFYFEKEVSKADVLRDLKRYRSIYGKDDKGKIDDLGTGISAKPYVYLAGALDLLAKSNFSYVLAKPGRVYKVILNKYSNEPQKFRFIEETKLIQQSNLFDLNVGQGNIFVLNVVDKYFLIRQLLAKDFFYIKAILLTIDLFPNGAKEFGRYSSVKEHLKDELLREIDLYLEKRGNKQVEINDALRARDEILKGFTSIRSFELIVEPRIGWLLDLDLIDSVKHKNGELLLSKSGRTLLSNLKTVFKSSLFIDYKYSQVFASMYQLNILNIASPDSKVKKYLAYAFSNFRTLAPNRIAASQAFTYISAMLLLRDGIICEYIEIKDLIFEWDGREVNVDWFPSENDGSLKKI